MTHPGLAAPAPDVPPPYDHKPAYDWAEWMVNREGGQITRYRWALVEAYMAGREAMRREAIVERIEAALDKRETPAGGN